MDVNCARSCSKHQENQLCTFGEHATKSHAENLPGEVVSLPVTGRFSAALDILEGRGCYPH